MDLTGYRTVIAALVGGPLAALSVKYLGSSLDPATQNWLVGGIMMGLMVIMRMFTKTPIGKSVAQAHVDANSKLLASNFAQASAGPGPAFHVAAPPGMHP